VENQQYDEAVELSSSESVDEADVAPPPKPPQVSDQRAGLVSCLPDITLTAAYALQVKMSGSATSGSGAGSASGSGGGSARGGGGGGSSGGGGGSQQGAQSAHIGSGEEDEGNSETSSDEEDDEEGVQATQGYNPADYANLQVIGGGMQPGEGSVLFFISFLFLRGGVFCCWCAEEEEEAEERVTLLMLLITVGQVSNEVKELTSGS